jgi:hypothetical protein
MTECMFDFRLGDNGEIELANVGETTQESILETCYPELGKAISVAEWDDSGVGYSAKGLDQIRKGPSWNGRDCGKTSCRRRKLTLRSVATFKSKLGLPACS